MAPRRFDYQGLFARSVPTPAKAFTSLTEQFKYDFAIAFADPDTFPSMELHRALKTALEEEGGKLAYYPHPQGHPAMRELLADTLARTRGMKVSADRIVLTAGSMQALVLLHELFVDPGDTLITEDFLYMGTIRVMRRFQANLVGVGTDEEGMRPDLLEQSIRELKAKGARIKFIYTVPTFCNPIGTDMGLERRKEVLSVAQRHGIPIFEDDCYVDLRFEGEPSPAIYSLDDSDSVLYCGSSSKIVGPGMRLGWLVAPREVVERVGTIHLGATPSQFSVLAALHYLREHREGHVSELNQVYKARRDVMLAAVREHMGTAAVVSRPKGGMYLWVKLPEGTDTVALLEKAKARNVRYGPGPIFSPSSQGANYLRLCFAHLDEETIREGIAELARVFEEEGVLG
ncbi:MAG: PLP-dependent aminotransferase family protein [Dehalococcoidia bacterium]